MKETERTAGPHSLILEGRERLSISGVEDVESFDEKSIVAQTTRGTLVIHGSALHIGRLSLETGDLAIDGSVDSLEYLAGDPGGGFWRRLFG